MTTTKTAPWSELPPDFHGAEVINVLGGGPSVKPYVDRLKELDGPWFGACRAGLLIDAEMTIGCDGRFPRQCPEEISEALDRGRHVVHPIRPHVRVNQIDHLDPRIRIIGWKMSGVSKEMASIRGLDSGFACFNAALLYKPKTIRLFGLDYKAPKNQERFHDGYKNTQVKGYDRMLWSWAHQYSKHITEIESFGCSIEMYVGEPRSRIVRFPIFELKDLFDERCAASA